MPQPLRLIVATLLVTLLAAPAASATGPSMAAGADPETRTILVKVRAGESAAAAHRQLGFDVLSRIRPLRVDVVAVPAGQVREALQRYRALPEVRYAERNRVVHLSARPDDPLVEDQYALARTKAFRGWDRYDGGWRQRGGARIAIVDSGVDVLHPEFAGKISHCRSWQTGLGIATGTCHDLQVHGTHVAGVAAALAGNGDGVAGVAYDAEIMALQAFNSSGMGLTADIAAAIIYAADNGADVANYSFGGAARSKTQRDAVRYAAAHGVVQVAAAGNAGDASSDEVPGVDFPARLRQVIAVSATDARDRLAEFSSFGHQVEVAAPGDQIISTLPGGLYGTLSGTSMATPHVAGLAALLRAQGYGPAETRRRIRAGADDLGPAGRDRRFGHGRVNVNRSLR